MDKRLTVHSEPLDDNTRLDVIWHNTIESECYTFSLVYHVHGNEFGRGSSGEWFASVVVAIASGIIWHGFDNKR